MYGPEGGASGTTLVRVLGKVADRLTEGGLPGRRPAVATATARATAWVAIIARHQGLPAVRAGGLALTRPARTIGRSKLVCGDQSSPYVAPLAQLALMSFGPPLVVSQGRRLRCR